MKSPNGIRTESAWIPNASRAGALYSTLLHATSRKCRAAIHACNLTSGNPGPVDNSRSTPIARRTWMAAPRLIGGGC